MNWLDFGGLRSKVNVTVASLNMISNVIPISEENYEGISSLRPTDELVEVNILLLLWGGRSNFLCNSDQINKIRKRLSRC